MNKTNERYVFRENEDMGDGVFRSVYLFLLVPFKGSPRMEIETIQYSINNGQRHVFSREIASFRRHNHRQKVFGVEIERNIYNHNTIDISRFHSLFGVLKYGLPDRVIFHEVVSDLRHNTKGLYTRAKITIEKEKFIIKPKRVSKPHSPRGKEIKRDNDIYYKY